MPPTPCQSSCHVGDKIAKNRVDLFTSTKWKVLNNTVDDEENQSYPVDRDNFLWVFDRFAKSVKNYNGVRLYFAAGVDTPGNPSGIPHDQIDKLTVIFVPTLGPRDVIGGTDDLAECWWLYNGKKYNFPNRDPENPGSDLATQWIENYRLNKRECDSGLNDDGANETGDDFNDTKCIWYKMATIKGDGNADCGMIQFIKDRMPAVTGITITFGAYTEVEADSLPYYQLTVIFYLNEGHEEQVIPLGTVVLSTNFKKDKLHPFDMTTDTGLPCPPADPCNNSLFKPAP